MTTRHPALFSDRPFRVTLPAAPPADDPDVVQSLSYDQDVILRGILRLAQLDTFDADLTYGNGIFYRGTVPQPRLRFDLDPQQPGTVAADSTRLPLRDASIGSAVFDPPFLTYVRAGRGGNGAMTMARRFGGYWRYDELEAHYRGTLAEAARVLTPGGLLVMKCQDLVHNHRLHPTHVYTVGWAAEVGLRLADLYVLAASHRLPSPNRRGTQKHARIHHSYFLVLRKESARKG